MGLSAKSRSTIPLSFNLELDAEGRKLLETCVIIPQGKVHSLDHCVLLSNGQPIDCSARITSHWNDNSIKWLHICFVTLVDQNAFYELALDPNQSLDITRPKGLLVVEKDTTIEVTNRYSKVIVNKSKLTMIFESINEQNPTIKPCSQHIELTDDTKLKLHSSVDSIETNQFQNLKDGSDAKTELTIKGSYRKSENTLFAEFELKLAFFQFHSAIKYEFTIHNPNSAIHPGGKWDLGDPNSIYLNTLRFVVTNTNKQNLSYQLEQNDKWIDFSNCETRIEQYSSGGVNWQSPVHQINSQSVPHLIKGYQHIEDGLAIETGERATPTVVIEKQLSLTLRQFWQNFPKAINLTNDEIALALYPEQQDKFHELQPGEKKTHTIWLGTQGNTDELNWVHQPTMLGAEVDWDNTSPSEFAFSNGINHNAISTLIANGLSSKNNFFEKREIIDEFGWRNFGDIYADHETAGFKGNEIFVSHYNNQYDPIFGFLKQFLLTGNNRWFELADDLAKHVKDIDIYHTQLDKKEYNGGLFWHTDHYLQAFTSSHRSYSKHQSSDAYQDHAGGGGPGGQHCYTTGLMLHYCMTGSDGSKQAVLTLSDWITNVYEGSDTCLELLLAFKNRHVDGLKNHFTGQYPLDRGTANYVVAILDSFELTQELKYLEQAETILRNSMHPDEDLSARHLDNVEDTWFYTVLLQALCRYLEVKQTRQELDDNFYYCRDCLLNFADWMVAHEYPYLDKPDILEYPNDTWTAQDLRKSHVFAAAYYYSNNHQDDYLTKAKFFEKYVADELNSSDTKTYTRILVLLMQNCGAVDFYEKKPLTIEFKQKRDFWPQADYQTTSLNKGLVSTLGKRLLKISFKNERDWLKKRLA
jgi:hypothetical protein